MTTQNATQCTRCESPWEQQMHPRTGPREQCGNCGNLRKKPSVESTGSPAASGMAATQSPAASGMAATMEMCAAGVMTSSVNPVLKELGLPMPREHRGSRRISQFARILRDDNPPPRVDADGDWAIIQVYSDSQEGGCDLAAVLDRSSQLIVAAGAEPVGTTPASLLRIALLRAKGPPSKITTNILGLGMNQIVEEQIRQSHSLRRENLEDITRGTRLEEFIRVIEARKRFQGKPSQEFLDNFLEILMQDLNFFRALSPTNGLSPAEAALMEPVYRRWEEVAAALIKRNNRPNNLSTYDSVQSGLVRDRKTGTRTEGSSREKQPAAAAPGRRQDHPEIPELAESSALAGNDALLDELQSFIEKSEAKRDYLRQKLLGLDEAAEAALKLRASLQDDAVPAGS